ncbi:MAG: D-2-hydroxyacid dehydrogenase family protein [Neomegalonema sp.]|nr:D-2-hydroxyacid dehydrogenase family protein [Neomegalonema sp.]
MTSKLNVAVLDDYLHAAPSLADWGGLGANVVFFNDTIRGPALIERLQPFDVICLMRERTPFPAELINALPALRLIVTSGKRNLSIDIAAAAARGVRVCGTESRAPATAQHAMTLILAATRGLAAEAISMRDGGWQRTMGRDLNGLTLGLIGLGRLGEAVAALARPFGVRMIAWSQNLTDARCAEVGVERAPTLHDLLAFSDIASIHQVLSDRTRSLINADALAAMKPDAILVNTSRGPILDSAALLNALHADRLGAAALDVFDDEPLPADHPLRDRALIDAGRLILTPHIGYGSRQTYELFYRQTAEAIAAWRDGAPIRELKP